ncbi:MAG TPA: hypothetical protein PK385_05410 [Spirochaetota bacterium]|nr:hypothetical protein [Spirochaetota bacterium]HOS32166.1 hypothetical protein [Spirochaetota bacterium]HOS55475.1 hypothetical protein [Spirochaetota bacterium]HPK60961.1 hypothetical protein [Spirochaetota bacterium]HQF78044.1 hypothetical protein [Spirochaetota bacterium]
MIDFNDLIARNDFQSVVFREFLLKTGQISTEIIFSSELFKSDISYNRDKCFLNLIKPLLDYCDSFVRLKDINSVSINFIFLLKEDKIEEIRSALQKLHVEKFKSSSAPTVDQIKKFKNEINESNILKFIAYFKNSANAAITPIDLIKEIEFKMKNIRPYEANRIALDLYNIARIIAPNWNAYLQHIVSYAKNKTTADKKIKAKKSNIIKDLIIEKKFYWDFEKNSYPLYKDVISNAYKYLFSNSEEEIDRNDIVNFFKSSANFIIFKIKKETPNPPEINDKFMGLNYKIYKIDDNNINILENSRQVKILSNVKTEFFKKKIRNLLIPSIDVIIKDNFKEEIYNDDAYICFKENLAQEVEEAIKSKNYLNIKISEKLLKSEEFRELRNFYEITLDNMAEILEFIVLEKAILDYIKRQKKHMNFFYVLLNGFFSKWNESNFNRQITAQTNKLNKIADVSEKIKATADSSLQNRAVSDYNPVQAAINIIKSNLLKSEIKNIFAKDSSPNDKLIEILNLYDDIGATNKAIIAKTDRSREEFFTKLKEILK